MHVSAQRRAEEPCLPLLGAVTAARFSFLPLALQRGRRSAWVSPQDVMP